MVFADDHLLEREALSEKLREAGVIFQPLERAMIEHEELFRRHFMNQPATLGSAKFAALHQALVRSGTFLYVPRGIEIELPLETFHWLSDARTPRFSRTPSSSRRNFPRSRWSNIFAPPIAPGPVFPAG